MIAKKDAPAPPPKLDLLKLSLKDLLPGSEKLDEAEKWLQEARDHLDRAVTLAPTEPEVYRARFLGRLNQAFANIWITTARGRIPDPIQQNPLILMCQPEARADLYQLTRHAPDDYLALGFMAQTELQAHVYQNPGTVLDGKTLLAKGMSAECRQRLQEAKEKLERFSQGTERIVAARCGLILGWLQVLCGETDAAIATMRRVTALDSSLTDAWSILIGALNGQERSDEAVAVCTERLKTEDTANARFALAWTYSRSPKHHDQAEGQLRLALERDAKEFHALVGLAAMLLQRASEAATLAEAGTLLDRAQPLVGKDEGRGKDWSLNQGIYLALTGNVTQARFCLLNVLVVDPRHQYAGHALKALSE